MAHPTHKIWSSGPGWLYNPVNPPSLSQRSRRHRSTVSSRRKKTVGLDLGTSRGAVIIAESADVGGAAGVIGVGDARCGGPRQRGVVDRARTSAGSRPDVVSA